MKINKYLSSLKKWIQNNRIEFFILLAILILAAFFRLYRIDQYMTFLGDEGRDVIIVRNIFVNLHPPLIGPGTSVGSMYLGPLYYYLMAVPLLLANFSPLGPAVMIALLATATVAFVWWVGRTWFDKTTGIIASALFAISPVVIIYSRSSWNPNIMPFFALLCIFAIWKVWQKSKFNWLIVLGISFAFVLQSHYMGLLLTPTLFTFWLLTFIKLKGKPSIKPFIKKSILGVILFLFLMSPLVIFDFRHNFINANAFYKFFTEGRISTFGQSLSNLLLIPTRFGLIARSLISAKNNIASILSSILMVAGLVYVFVKRKSVKLAPELWLIVAWLGFALIGLSFYQESIYDHYLGFVFPIPFLLMGLFISKLISAKNFLKIIGWAIFVYLTYVNLIGSPLLKDPNRLLQRSINVSKIIEENSANSPFNLAVIADTNYEDGYKYFLLKDNYPVVDIDSQLPETITDQLFVVCELIPNSKCDPTHSPKAQVANFGWSKIDGSWEVDGTIVYKLIHTE